MRARTVRRRALAGAALVLAGSGNPAQAQAQGHAQPEGQAQVPARAGGRAEPLLTRPLPGIAGMEGTMLTVEYPPGGASPPHRHDASTFVYVLEGAVVMQVEGGERVTLSAGDTFHEWPSDVHVVSRNASATEPARILVFMVKKEGAPITTPVE